MKHIDRETQNWFLYRKLELLPAAETHSEPAPTFGLNRLWNGLLGLLTEELVEEQRVEYLERCLKKSRSSGIRQFFKLIE